MNIETVRWGRRLVIWVVALAIAMIVFVGAVARDVMENISDLEARMIALEERGQEITHVQPSQHSDGFWAVANNGSVVRCSMLPDECRVLLDGDTWLKDWTE